MSRPVELTHTPHVSNELKVLSNGKGPSWDLEDKVQSLDLPQIIPGNSGQII